VLNPGQIPEPDSANSTKPDEKDFVLSAPPTSRASLPAFARFLIALVYAYIANRIAASLVSPIDFRHPLLADLSYRVLASAFLLGGFFLMLRLLDEDDRPAWDALTLPLERESLRLLGLGFVVGALLISIDVLVAATVGGMSSHFHLTAHSAKNVVIVILLLAFGALLEELGFRGYPFQRLLESVGPVWAILIFSVLFSAVHLANPSNEGLWTWSFANTLLVGVLFAVAFLRTRSLWLPIGMHFGWNLFQGAVFGLPVSGIQDFSVVVRSVLRGSHALTGGAYGPEDSATCAVILLLGFPILYFCTSQRASLAKRSSEPEPPRI
jgi:membrane protease YdiL (CAAX protease family)